MPITFTRLDKRLFKEMYCQDMGSFKQNHHPGPQHTLSIIPWDQECDAIREIELIIQARGDHPTVAIAAQSESLAEPAMVA